MGFADALSKAGVRYLAASPETMLAPGVPSDVAHAIASHENEPKAMAKSVAGVLTYDAAHAICAGLCADVVVETFNARFGEPHLCRVEIEHVERCCRPEPAEIAGVVFGTHHVVDAIQGMVRFPGAAKDMPWRADRPAIAFYAALAGDGRLDARLRNDAGAAAGAVADLVLAHRESDEFAPFGGADYSDAAGPTIHLPTTRYQIDPWASAGVLETKNAFYKDVDEAAMTGVLA